VTDFGLKAKDRDIRGSFEMHIFDLYEYHLYIHNMIGYLSESVLSGFTLCSIFLILLPAALYRLHDSLDRTACSLAILAGIIIFISMLLNLYTQDYRVQYIPRLLIAPVLLLVLTQILWFQKIRKIRWLRLLTATLLLICLHFPQLIIWVVSAHRDYLPSSFSVAFSTLICDLLLRLIVFFALLASFHLLRGRLFLNSRRQQY